MPQNSKHISLGDHMPQWQIATTISIAKVLGFQEEDIADAVEEIAIKLLAFNYDPKRASERTAIHAVIHNTLVDLLRAKTCRLRHVAMLEEHKSAIIEPSVPDHTDAVDLWEAVEHLDQQDQAICRSLSKGNTISEIAKELGLSWFRVDRAIKRLRSRFAAMGYGDRAHA
jgi:RNA polymerase sigma factor (sigma-70 family)